MVVRFFLAVLLCLAVSTVPVSARPNPAVLKAIAATWRLDTDESSCSAMAFHQDKIAVLLITARHCLIDDYGDPIDQATITQDGTKTYPVSTVALGEDENHDWAVLKASGLKAPAVEPLATTEEVYPGLVVEVVGFPYSLGPVYSQGRVSGQMVIEGEKVFSVDAFGAPGSSGSGVVNLATGHIVGILVGGYGDRGENHLAACTPASDISFPRPVAPVWHDPGVLGGA